MKRIYTSKLDEFKNIIDENYILLDNILFSTPSGAASFVCGASANGNVEWKTKEDKPIKNKQIWEKMCMKCYKEY